MNTVEALQWEQQLMLMFAYSYNNDEHPMTSDAIYDYGTVRLQRIKQEHPEVWLASSIYPEVFLDPDEAWLYTSSHFPATQEIKDWTAAHKARIALWEQQRIEA